MNYPSALSMNASEKNKCIDEKAHKSIYQLFCKLFYLKSLLFINTVIKCVGAAYNLNISVR